MALHAERRCLEKGAPIFFIQKFVAASAGTTTSSSGLTTAGRLEPGQKTAAHSCAPLNVRPQSRESVKCVAVGDSAVGKTCMLISSTTEEFPNSYDPTHYDSYAADVMVDGKPIALGLWDTSGHGDYDRLRPLAYPNADVFLRVFALTSKASLDSIARKWLVEARLHCPRASFILVGTKLDVRDCANPGHVTTLQGEAQTTLYGATVYRECSAKTQEGLKDVFDAVISVVMQARAENPRKKKTICSLFSCCAKGRKETPRPTAGAAALPQTTRAAERAKISL